jgi:hypothetical protein
MALAAIHEKKEKKAEQKQTHLSKTDWLRDETLDGLVRETIRRLLQGQGFAFFSFYPMAVATLMSQLETATVRDGVTIMPICVRKSGYSLHLSEDDKKPCVHSEDQNACGIGYYKCPWKGNHWAVLCVDKLTDTLTYWDPCGDPARYPGFVDYIKMRFPRMMWVEMKERVQDDSDNCGVWVVEFTEAYTTWCMEGYCGTFTLDSPDRPYRVLPRENAAAAGRLNRQYAEKRRETFNTFLKR